jgi:hypothetical protein
MRFDISARAAQPASTRLATSVASGAVILAVSFTGRLPASGEDTLQITSDKSVVSVTTDGQPVAMYQYSARPRKGYLKELYSPRGVNVLRDAPSDHLHHHGLMFAVAVDGVDFWSENEKCGWQKHGSLGEVHAYSKDGVPRAAFRQEVDWVGPDGSTLNLKERRTIEVCRTSLTGPTTLTWRCRLQTPPDKQSVTLTGSAYFGLGMRFVQSMDAGGKFVNADGKTGVEATNDVASAWCAYWASADGKPVTVAMFDCPKNPRHPATWFTMDSRFAYLSATLGLHTEPLVIASDKPLELRYAVALWDGHIEPEQVEKLYRQLVKGSLGAK